MGWDLFGQLVGKARRRQLETDGAKLLQINWGVLGTRLAAGAATGLLTVTAAHGLPATTGAILTAVAGGAVAAGPSALQASGLIRAVSPDTLSLAQAAGQTITSILSAPQAQRKQEMQTIATQAALQAVTEYANRTGSYTQSAQGLVPTPNDQNQINDQIHAEAPQNGTGTILGAMATVLETSLDKNGGNQ